MNLGYLIHLLWDSGAGIWVGIPVTFLLVVAAIAPNLQRMASTLGHKRRIPKPGDGIEHPPTPEPKALAENQ